MRRLSAGLLLFTVALSSCEKKPAASNAPVPTAPPSGAAESAGARVETPAGVRRVLLHRCAGVPLRGLPAGPAFSVESEQAGFAVPLRVTLPVDRALVPAGTAPGRVSAVLRMGADEELLRGGVVDLAAGTLTFELDRLVPLVNSQGGVSEPVEAVQAVLQAVLDPEEIVSLGKDGDTEYLAPRGMEAAARTMMESVKACLVDARKRLKPFGLPFPAALRVVLRPIRRGDPPEIQKGTLAQAEGGDTITVNSDTWDTTDAGFRFHGIAHECAHLSQQQYKIGNLRKSGAEIGPKNLQAYPIRWMDEGSAEFVANRAYPELGRWTSALLREDFALKALDTTGDDDAHEYQTGMLWFWLDTRYDAMELFRQCYQKYMSGAWTRVSLEDDQDANAGTWDSVEVLDRVLRATPDRAGHKAGLPSLFAEFLIHFGWKKDFEPLLSAPREDLFGKRGQIALPDDPLLLAWNVPDDGPGGRVVKQAETVSGGGFSIAKVIHISSMTKTKEAGDLVVRLKPGSGMKTRSVLIVFPDRGGVQEPVFGFADKPAVVPEWESCGGAIVWVVDVSRQGGNALEVTAELKPPDSSPLDLVLEPVGAPNALRRNEIHLNLQLRVNGPPDRKELEKTDEGRKKLAAMEESWRAQWDKALGGSPKWVHLEIAAGNVTRHFYALSRGLGFLAWDTTFLLPRVPGPVEVVATTTVLGKRLTYKTTVVLAQPEGGAHAEDMKDHLARLAAFRKRLKDLEKSGAGKSDLKSLKDDMVRSLLRVADSQQWLWVDAGADAAWKEALMLASPEDAHEIHAALAAQAFRCERLEEYLEELKKSGGKPDSRMLAVRWLQLKNDPERARQILRDGGVLERDIDLDLLAPKPGEGIMK